MFWNVLCLDGTVLLCCPLGLREHPISQRRKEAHGQPRPLTGLIFWPAQQSCGVGVGPLGTL